MEHGGPWVLQARLPVALWPLVNLQRQSRLLSHAAATGCGRQRALRPLTLLQPAFLHLVPGRMLLLSADPRPTHTCNITL